MPSLAIPTAPAAAHSGNNISISGLRIIPTVAEHTTAKGGTW